MINNYSNLSQKDCSKIGSFKRFSLSNDSFRFKVGNVSLCKSTEFDGKGSS